MNWYTQKSDEIVKVCKKHGDLTIDLVRITKSRNKYYYNVCVLCSRIARMKYVNNNSDRAKEQVKNWKIKNKEKVRNLNLKHSRKARDEINDSYVRKLIGLPKSQISDEFVDAWRIKVKILRKIKEIKDVNK